MVPGWVGFSQSAAGFLVSAVSQGTLCGLAFWFAHILQGLELLHFIHFFKKKTEIGFVEYFPP